MSAISVQRVSKLWGTTKAVDEVSFEATRLEGQAVTVDAGYVDARLSELSRDEDLSRYIL